MSTEKYFNTVYSGKRQDRLAAHARSKENIGDEIAMERGTLFGGEMLWAIYDSPLDRETDTSAYMYTYGIFATEGMDDSQVGIVKLKPYIEHNLRHKKGSAIGIEYGGPGSALFSEFDVFDRTLGVTLYDLRDEETKAHDTARNHTIITGDMQSPEVKAQVDAWLAGEQADFIAERMVGGLNTIPADPYHIASEFSSWYKQLAPGGMMLVAPPRIIEPLLKDWEARANEQKGLSVRVAIGFNSAVEVIKGQDDPPQDIPLLHPREIRAAYNRELEKRLSEEKEVKDRRAKSRTELLDSCDLGNYIGGGSNVAVYGVIGRSDIVVKRLLTSPDILPQGITPEEKFKNAQKQHEVMQQYFGADHIPQTTFIMVDNPQYGGQNPGISPGREYVLIQDRVFGVATPSQDAPMETFPAPDVPITDAMREQVDSFIKKYNKMQQETGTIPHTSGQVFFDYDDEKVTLVDTISTTSFSYYVKNNQFLERIGVDPQQILDSDNPSQAAIEAAAPYVDISYIAPSEFDGKVDTDAPRIDAMYTSLHESGFELRELLGLNRLFTGVAYFPPEGENIVVRQIREMGLTSPATQIEDTEQDLLSQEPKVGESSSATIGLQEEDRNSGEVYVKNRKKTK